MVVDLDPSGVKAYGVYPGSQKGNPGNPWYGHMIDRWANGDYYELAFGPSLIDPEEITYQITLAPQ
jgi:penicillin amidase